MKALIATIALIASANAAAWDSGFAGGFMNGLNSARGVQTQQQPKQPYVKPFQEETYYDRYNMPIGSSTTDSFGNTTYYDSYNMPIGTKRKW